MYAIEGGTIYSQKGKGVQVLPFAIKDSIKLLREIYYNETVPALSRKRKIAEEYMLLTKSA